MVDKRLPHRMEVLGPHQALADLARRQHGVVSIRQMTGPLGYSRSAVVDAARAGRLHRLYRGVYAVGHTRLSLHGRCLAAVLACGRGALLSHYSAAWLWGLTNGSPVPIEVTTPIPRKARVGLRIHHSRILRPADRTIVEGIPVTSLARTLLDMAVRARFDRFRRMVERSEELGLLDLASVDELLPRAGGHHGRRRLRRALAIHRPARVTRSGLERRFLALVLDAGLPRPATNFHIHGYELDVYWPDHRFAVELDLFETHGTRAAFERDRIRQEDLKLAGIEMTRVTGTRLDREPGAVLSRVSRLLAQSTGRKPT